MIKKVKAMPALERGEGEEREDGQDGKREGRKGGGMEGWKDERWKGGRGIVVLHFSSAVGVRRLAQVKLPPPGTEPGSSA